MIRQLGRVATVFAAFALATTALAACGDDDENEASPDATIEMSEYHYDVSGDIPTGGTIRLKNSGDEFHMIGLAKLKPGKTMKQAIKAIQSETQDDDAAVYDEWGQPAGIVGPGQEADVSARTLAPGHYVMACFINVAGKETPHFMRGMTGEFTVTGDKADTPAPDATYETSPGKAITGPTTLDAGYRVLKVHRSPDGEGLEPSLIKLDDGKTVEDFAKAIKVFDEGPLPRHAADLLPGDFILGLFDYNDATDVSIGVKLEKGTYILSAQDSDQDDAPDVPVEKILITVT